MEASMHHPSIARSLALAGSLVLASAGFADPDPTPTTPLIEVFKPICAGARPPQSTIDAIGARHAAGMQGADRTIIVPTTDAGLRLRFEVAGPAPAGTTEALAAIADLYAGIVADDVELTIEILFEPLGTIHGLPILGAAGDSYRSLPYAAVRATLIDTMDGDDVIEASLPDAASLRIIYGLEPGARTEDRDALLTGVALRALLDGQTPAPLPVSLSSTAPWDTDPADGVALDSYCLRSVMAHEIGHVLGFQSNVDLLFGATLLPLDIYRFRESDGGADLNPDTYARFMAAPRTVYLDAPGAPDENEAILDFIAAEIPMADGDPWQGSHLRKMDPPIGAMDPDIVGGETDYPGYLTAADLRPLDALGWTITLACPADCDGSGSLDFFDFLCFQDAFDAGDPSADLDGDGELTVFDFLAFQNAFDAGCG
ncbi:hypothetical protein AY599_16155 [Leptolyngbya valderiana BDU 20041]|nr:hypothetical protein AY599_16155 [Leptolyngbya valderiana BDU 20041]